MGEVSTAVAEKSRELARCGFSGLKKASLPCTKVGRSNCFAPVITPFPGHPGIFLSVWGLAYMLWIRLTIVKKDFARAARPPNQEDAFPGDGRT